MDIEKLVDENQIVEYSISGMCAECQHIVYEVEWLTMEIGVNA